MTSKDQKLADDKRTEWRSTAEAIKMELVQLHLDRKIFWQYNSILNNSRDEILRTGGHFHRWVQRNYAKSAAMAVRKQTDMKSENISLHNLLVDIAKYHSIITKESYLAAHQNPKDPLRIQLATKEFERMAGNPEFLDPFVVQGDLQKLSAVSEKIRKQVNENIAHTSPRKKAKPITYDELDSCINTFGEIARKYILLLTAGYEIFEPMLDPWDSIFSHSWFE